SHDLRDDELDLDHRHLRSDAVAVPGGERDEREAGAGRASVRQEAIGIEAVRSRPQPVEAVHRVQRYIQRRALRYRVAAERVRLERDARDRMDRGVETQRFGYD